MSWACDPALASTVAASYQTVLPSFAHALQTFMAAQCAIVGDHVWPKDAAENVLRDPNYDFIVVGAGSAGSVVANRLSEIPDWKVLLIEAGGNPTASTEMPLLFFNNLNSDLDWQYKNQPEDSCRGYKNKACAWPRGKVLGGSSSINGLYYVRGSKVDYNEWAANGNNGWSYEEVLPYFIKSENFSEQLTVDSQPYHGSEGYWNIDHRDDADDIEKLIIRAASESGLKYVKDVNGPSQMGVTKCSTSIKDGLRQSAARAFLSTVKDRKNLHVLKHAHVTNLLFKPNSNIVNGIQLNKDGKKITVNARKEVIISAGAINTPQLLMLSGIGPQNHLEDLGIIVKADLPVGENLQDHLAVPLFFQLQKPVDNSLNDMPNIVGAFTQWVLSRSGPFGNTSPFRVISFMNTTDPSAVSPDIQHHYLVYTPKVSQVVDIFGLHGFNDEFLKEFYKLNENNVVMSISVVLLNPKSRGKIRLSSADPFKYPLIFANYLKEEYDMETVLKSIRQHSLKLSKTKAFMDAGFELKWPNLQACSKYAKESDDFLRCYARETTMSLYHPTSTAKMGPDQDPNAVVDSQLRVRKVNGLRVIDASIMPTIVRGNTNAPTIMIGEKGADLIKKHWLDVHTEL